MTSHDTRTVTYASVEEAKDGLQTRGVSIAAWDNVETAIRAGAEELLRRYDLPDEMDVYEVRRTLTIGTAEYISEWLDADVLDETDVRKLAERIHENPTDELALVVGRMGSRDAAMRRIAAALHRESMQAEN